MKALLLALLIVPVCIYAAPVTMSAGDTVIGNGLVTTISEVPTPQDVIEDFETQLLIEKGEYAWEDPIDDILDPVPDDFDLPLPIPGPIGGGSEVLIVLEQIVNLGERVWKFVKDNKAIIKVSRKYANALPKGVRSSEELDGFTPLKYRSFNMRGRNGFGNEAFDLTYTLVHRHGGNFKGAGNYLENVTVLPQKIKASWGYEIECGVEDVGVVNVGTADKPVGSAVMELHIGVSNVWKTVDYRTVYEFRGDSRSVTTINNDGARQELTETQTVNF